VRVPWDRRWLKALYGKGRRGHVRSRNEVVWSKFKGGLLTIGRRLTSAMAVIGEAIHLAPDATRFDASA
jgi:hypothetical protein